MKEQNVEFPCDGCGKYIGVGKEMWSVNLNQEIWEDGAITVLDAYAAFTFCEKCAAKKDFEKITIPDKKEKHLLGSMKSLPSKKENIAMNNNVRLNESASNGELKKVNGFQEWAVASVNVSDGCANGCLYCYAQAINKRFKKNPDKPWEVELIRTDKVEKNYPKYKGRVGIPSSHDITPGTLDAVITVLWKLVLALNDILVVSKPRLDCIKKICDEFVDYKDQFLFRFTISTMDTNLIKFWEPNAPLYEERKASLKYAYDSGFQTSVSMEPLLDSNNVLATIDDLAPYVTDSIWIGKMNRIPSMKDSKGNPPSAYEQGFIDKIRDGQTPERIKAIYKELQEYPDLFEKIKFKDSYKKILGLEAATVAGQDV